MTRVAVGRDVSEIFAPDVIPPIASMEAIYAMGQMEPVDHVYDGYVGERHLMGKVSETSYRLWLEKEHNRTLREEKDRARRTELMQQVADLQRVIDELRKPPPQSENDTAALCSKLWNAEITMEEFDDQFVAAWEAEQREPAKGLGVDGWLSPREPKGSVLGLLATLFLAVGSIAGTAMFIIGMWFANWPVAMIGALLLGIAFGIRDPKPEGHYQNAGY